MLPEHVMQTLDPDTRAVIAFLRDVLATSGMSQGSFGGALGTSGSRFSTYLNGTTRPSAHFCMRAQRLAHSLAAAAGLGLMSPPRPQRCGSNCARATANGPGGPH